MGKKVFSSTLDDSDQATTIATIQATLATIATTITSLKTRVSSLGG